MSVLSQSKLGLPHFYSLQDKTLGVIKNSRGVGKGLWGGCNMLRAIILPIKIAIILKSRF